MKTKAVIATHLHKGQRFFFNNKFYLIDSVLNLGHYIEISVQGGFYPICIPSYETVKVKL